MANHRYFAFWSSLSLSFILFVVLVLVLYIFWHSLSLNLSLEHFDYSNIQYACKHVGFHSYVGL